ncbi:MAG: hypothetical protein K6T83_03640 [Alicyclobacillus sp.]|nr:hypothetical protein [Alicyclobacillus sp.]
MKEYIGRAVVVYRVDGLNDGNHRVILADVNRYGITVQDSDELAFVPWSSIRWINLNPKPSPDFIAEAKKRMAVRTDPESDTWTEVKTERAKVGDVIRVNATGCYPNDSLWLFHGSEYVVHRVGSRSIDDGKSVDGVFGKASGEGQEIFIPHGHYDIVFRAEPGKHYAPIDKAAEPERAKVGDVVRQFRTTLCHTVKAVNDECVILSCDENGEPSEWLPHGTYEIVSRADSNKPIGHNIYCSPAGKGNMHYVGFVPAGKSATIKSDRTLEIHEAEPSSADSWPMTMPSTADLIEMLATREGAMCFPLEEGRDGIVQYEKLTNLWSMHTTRVKGPCTILVIPAGELR